MKHQAFLHEELRTIIFTDEIDWSKTIDVQHSLVL